MDRTNIRLGLLLPRPEQRTWGFLAANHIQPAQNKPKTTSASLQNLFDFPVQAVAFDYGRDQALTFQASLLSLRPTRRSDGPWFLPGPFWPRIANDRSWHQACLPGRTRYFRS
jgi:hypothetical protein